MCRETYCGACELFCSVYTHIDPGKPVTVQSRVGMTNSVSLLFSVPRGIGQGAGANGANVSNMGTANLVDQSSMKSAHDHNNVNIREGGALGGRGVGVMAPSNRRRVNCRLVPNEM